VQVKQRCVLAELLDDMAPEDPLAQESRRDLQRIHIAMGTLASLRRALARLRLSARPRRILELGAGDGTLLLRLAHTLAADWPDVELTLLDRHDLIGKDVRAAYRGLGWQVSVVTTDVLDWAHARGAQHYDLCVTALFLHHFAERELANVLAAVAARADAFIACEPRRNTWAWLGSRLVGVIGGNRITRSDAVSSVAAGFAGLELSRSWPDPDNRWALEEWHAFPFTHCFLAQARDLRPNVAGS
jgi:SAM-dependent methyltransferase